MADPSFERRLRRLFAEPSPAPDAALFARRLEQRLERAWAVRRTAIGLAGAGAGTVAFWSGLRSIARTPFGLAMQAPVWAGARWAGRLAADLPLLRALPLRSLPFGGEVSWLLFGLVLIAGGLLAARALDDV